jgi:carboxyl-terminal processing protease
MRRIFIGLLLGLSVLQVLPLVAQPVAKNDKSAEKSGSLAPSLKQQLVQRAIMLRLQKDSYKRKTVDDSLSVEMLKQYIIALDRGKVYFLQEDIDWMERYKYELDDALKSGDLNPAYDIYNVFKKRYEERLAFVPKCLEKGFDFTIDESYNADYESAPYAKTALELDETWRKILKSQALDLKLSGKDEKSIIETVQKRYDIQQKNAAKTNAEDVFSIYINALCAAIDPHTNYLPPANADNFKIDMSLSLEGIGARLSSENEYTKIFEVVPGGPAFKSKLVKKDDKITAVAQGDTGTFVDVIGWRLDDVVKLIRGPKGSVVRLQIIPAESGTAVEQKTIRLVREKINLEEQAAKKKLITTKVNGKERRFGVITLPLFYLDFDRYQKGDPDYRSTTKDIKKLIAELEKEKIDGLVIDLRNNGGGALPEAISLTGLFVPQGPVVQVRDVNSGVDVQTDDDPSVVYKGPLAVMVNRFSASASEIFAAAIQDYNRGIIIGEQTFGKGTVQNLLGINRMVPYSEPLGDLKLTVAKFYRVNGSSTQQKGVMPDITMPSPYKDNEFGEDSEPNALEWDVIPTATFKPYTGAKGELNEKMLTKLRKKHDDRAKTNEEYREFIKDVEDIRKRRENKIISLLESKRKAERDELEKKRLAKTKKPEVKVKSELPDEDADESISKNKDAVLNEGLRVLADFVDG